MRALILDRLTLATLFLCAGLGAATTPPRAQQISEGGMRFYKRNVDAMSFRSGSTAGTNAQGSATVRAGTINTGAALSDVASELNPLPDSSAPNQELNIAGEPRQWNESLRLQRSTPSSITASNTNVIAIGNLDDNIRTILTMNPRLVEIIRTTSPTNPNQPLSKVQLSETHEKLEELLDSQTKGVHIFSASAIELPKPTKPNKSPTYSLNAWTSDEQIRTSPRYSGYASDINSISSEQENIIRVTSLGPVGTTSNSSNFSVVGFKRNINPNDGKVSSITAFATNNRTVGTIRVPDKNDGTKTTLEAIADKYGTTPEQLVVVNNLPDVNTDITGLNLTVPADLLTADYYIVKPASDGQTNETPRSLAKRLGVNVSWLMDLNGWTDTNQILPTGERVQVPGLTKSCSSAPNASGCRDTALPAAKPLSPELETADYGAYTKTEVTYDCSGALKSFCLRFLKPMR